MHQPFAQADVGIDALRLIAAVLVMGSHLTVSAWLRSRNGGAMPTTAFLPSRPLFCYGWIGVKIVLIALGKLRLLPRVITIVGAISTLYRTLIALDPFWSGRLWLPVHKARLGYAITTKLH